jgi:hypothetical protein
VVLVLLGVLVVDAHTVVVPFVDEFVEVKLAADGALVLRGLALFEGTGHFLDFWLQGLHVLSHVVWHGLGHYELLILVRDLIVQVRVIVHLILLWLAICHILLISLSRCLMLSVCRLAPVLLDCSCDGLSRIKLIEGVIARIPGLVVLKDRRLRPVFLALWLGKLDAPLVEVQSEFSDGASQEFGLRVQRDQVPQKTSLLLLGLEIKLKLGLGA